MIVIQLASCEDELSEDWQEFFEGEAEKDYNIRNYLRFCPFNFQPVCFGSYYGPYECPGNPEGCVYNINDENFMENI